MMKRCAAISLLWFVGCGSAADAPDGSLADGARVDSAAAQVDSGPPSDAGSTPLRDAGPPVPGPIPTENIDYPTDMALVHDVKREFGARGDGMTDDTAALRRAFETLRDGNQIIYLPPDTYRVSDYLNFGRWTYVQGAGQDRTILQLVDDAPNYQDPMRARWVIGSLSNTPPDISGTCNECFSNYLSDLTVDTGRGNPGAIGVEMLTNNGGGLENVTVRSGDGAGVIGVDFRHLYNGPGYSRNLTVRGFDRGIVTAEWSYATIFEHVFLSDQRVAGFENRGHPVAVRHLVSTNTVPAYVSADGDSGTNVLLDLELTGGASANPAIRITGSGGVVYARNASIAGYGSAVDNRGAAVSAPLAPEWYSGTDRDGWQSLFGSPTFGSLKLPVQDRPFVARAPVSEWVNVQRFRAMATGDDGAPAIQAAIDSGAKVIYFPADLPPIRTTVRVRNAVEWFVGFTGRVEMTDPMAPAWRIEDGSAPVVGFQYSVFYGGTVEHASTRTLVVHHARHMRYRSAAHPGGMPLGDLFVDDMSGDPFVFSRPQNAWLRALNTEGTGVRLTNLAANVWILGYKTEAVGTDVLNGPGARTEVLGGLTYPTNRNAPYDTTPLYENQGGWISVIARMADGNPIRVRETRRGMTRDYMVPGSQVGEHKVLAYTTGEN